jgi:hypothetical protein
MSNNRPLLALATLCLLILALVVACHGAPEQPQPPATRFPVETAESPLSLPAGGSIWIPLPSSAAPTEPAPVVTIAGVIVDDASGHPVAASVQVVDHQGVEHVVRQVNQFHLTMPAASAVTISVTAPGYQLWSVRIEPHVRHSAELRLPVRLLPATTEPPNPHAGRLDRQGTHGPPARSVDM